MRAFEFFFFFMGPKNVFVRWWAFHANFHDLQSFSFVKLHYNKFYSRLLAFRRFFIVQQHCFFVYGVTLFGKNELYERACVFPFPTMPNHKAVAFSKQNIKTWKIKNENFIFLSRRSLVLLQFAIFFSSHLLSNV